MVAPHALGAMPGVRVSDHGNRAVAVPRVRHADPGGLGPSTVWYALSGMHLVVGFTQMMLAVVLAQFYQLTRMRWSGRRAIRLCCAAWFAGAGTTMPPRR